MAINATDVQIMRPERVTDNTDGGGQMTGTAIASGDVNNLWDDIPRTMLAYGGVSLRKLFCAIRSANVDKFLGGHAIIQSDSIADNVSTLLFSTQDHYDERASAQDKIEQFVVMGTRSPLRPVGTQRKGQTAVVMYADKESDAPRNGDVLVFKSSTAEQYVKVTDVSIRKENYTYVFGTTMRSYSAFELIIRITQPLNVDFNGSDPSPLANHDLEVFKTQSATSAHYYGVKPVISEAAIGDATVKADGIFQSIVPTATTETALIDQKPGLSVQVLQPTSDSVVEKNMGSLSGSISLTLANCFTPNTLEVEVDGSVYRDAGAGLELLTGTSRLDLELTTVNRITGALNLVLLSSSVVIVRYIPAVAIELVPYSESVAIDMGNRQLTYVEQLSPAPMPGALRIEYQYLGQWYELTDNGAGVITGEGTTGIINYNSGSLSFSLPAEPDTGSSIIYTWTNSPYEIDQSVQEPPSSAFIKIPVPTSAISGTVVLTWDSNGTSCTATEGVDRSITGDATGFVLGREITLIPDSGSLPTSDISIDYSKHADPAINVAKQINTQNGGSIAVNLGDTNIDPSSVELSLSVFVGASTIKSGNESLTSFRSTVSFRGRGTDLVQLNKTGFGSGVDSVVGSINAATGIVTIDADKLQQKVRDFEYTSTKERLTYTTVKTQTVLSQTITITYHNTFSPTPQSFTAAVSDLDMEIPLGFDYLVPGALAFDVGGVRIVDRGDGSLYRSWNEQTGAGVHCGEINYSTADIVLNYNLLSSVVSGLSCNIIALSSGLVAASAVTSVVFRTNASPLRPSGLQFLARRITDTALLRAESENDGTISGSFNSSDVLGELPQPAIRSGYNIPIVSVSAGGGSATGNVDYQTGIVTLTFSQPVILSTLTYNAVAYNTVPLNADVLGLNPVKLPTDGRVPIFQPGYLVVIHNSKTLEVATPTANQVIDCGRINLAQLEIVDSAGTGLALDQYVVDKLAGTATLTNPFNAVDSAGAPLVMPLTVTHRIEDICAVGNVNIDGTLGLLTQLTHDYSAGDSYVSSAISFGTMQGRIYNVFSQKINQSGVFKDELNGDATVASYDDINYPILIDNLSSVQERWKIRFTNSTGFELIGETLGVVGVGSTAADFSPINPMTDAPYFTIRADGWGSGWLTNNILRFNTDAAAKPIWAIRTVLPSTEPVEKDFINIEFRGDAD